MSGDQIVWAVAPYPHHDNLLVARRDRYAMDQQLIRGLVQMHELLRRVHALTYYPDYYQWREERDNQSAALVRVHEPIILCVQTASSHNHLRRLPGQRPYRSLLFWQ